MASRGPGVGRDTVLLAVLMLVLVVGLSLRSKNAAEDAPHPGFTVSVGPDGAKGLFLLYGRLGRTLEQATDALGDFGDVKLAFVIAPEEPLGPADLPGLRGWVERGGTLVYGYAVGEPDSRPLHDVFGIATSPSGSTLSASVPLPGGFAPARTVSVPLGASVAARRERDAFTPIGVTHDAAEVRRSRAPGRDNPEAPIAMMAIGEGRVIAMPAASLGNKLLGEEDNAVFLALLAERYAGGEPIAFDEWSHGLGGTTSVLNLSRPPLLAGLALGVMAFVLYALAGRRLGPPSVEPPPARRATIEQVEALARFYQKTGARQAAADALGLAAPNAAATDADLLRAARQRFPSDGPIRRAAGDASPPAPAKGA